MKKEEYYEAKRKVLLNNYFNKTWVRESNCIGEWYTRIMLVKIFNRNRRNRQKRKSVFKWPQIVKFYSREEQSVE